MNAVARGHGRERVSVRRRAVVFLPNGLTLFNLFCGIYAIVKATRGEYPGASFFIVLGGVADMLDGRIARATGTGTRIGEELDSLVDALTFGFAPAMIMFFVVLSSARWEWLFVFIYTACAVMRLARFNVEQAGRKKTHFHGLPSPAAGITLASYYWFSQTSLYNQTIILFTDSKTLADLPWHTLLPGLMAVLGALMISNVPYAAVPSVGFRSVKQALGSLFVLACIAGLIFLPREFIFPALIVYVLHGFLKWAVLGFLGSSSTPDEIFWDQPEPVPAAPGRGRPTPRHVAAHPAIVDTTPSAERARERERARDTEYTEPRPSEAQAGAGARRRRRRRRPGGGQNRPPESPSGGTPPSSPPSDSTRNTPE